MTDQAKANLQASLDRKQGALGANLMGRVVVPECIYGEATPINTRPTET